MSPVVFAAKQQATAIAAVGADVLALQEVTARTLPASAPRTLRAIEDAVREAVEDSASDDAMPIVLCPTRLPPGLSRLIRRRVTFATSSQRAR